MFMPNLRVPDGFRRHQIKLHRGFGPPLLIRLELLAGVLSDLPSPVPDMLNERVMTQNHLLTRDRHRNHKLSINLQKSDAVFDDWSYQGPAARYTPTALYRGVLYLVLELCIK